MKVLKVKDNEELSLKAMEIVVDVLNRYESPVFGLATGSTPKRMYELLVEQYKQKLISFSRAISFNLDEYVGLAPTDPFSYRYYMERHLFNKVDMKEENIYIPNGLADNLTKECEAFEQAIEQVGPIHLQILGVGLNGHIGFNEPGTSFSSRTHVAKLENSTREVNSRFFNSVNDVPQEALTMGIGTIMEANQIILLVQGKHKANILHEIVHGDITEQVPASILQKHPNALVITDIDV